MKARTSSQPALDLDGPAVFAHDAISHRKPQSRSLASALGSEERIIDALQVLGCDALPIVTYIDACKPIRVPGLDGEPPPLFHGVARIQEEVQENLLQLAGISLHTWQAFLEIERDFDSRFPQLVLDQAQRFADQLVQIHFHVLGGSCSG